MSTPEFYAILTDAAMQLQFECLDSDKRFEMLEIAVGDGNGSYYEPEKTQTKLKNECYRASISRRLTDEKGLVKSVILDIPEDVTGFTVREVGVFGVDGALLIIGKYPEYTRHNNDSGAITQQAIKVDLAQINELVLPILIDPSINTASVQYVDENFQKVAEKGIANGYAPLDDNGFLPAIYTPRLADKDLSNLSETGEKHFLGKSQITNCITGIPQRTKADVVDGTLTVYAGTVAIVPYGIYDLRKESYGELDPEKPNELYSIGDTFIHENFKIVDMQFTRREDTEDNPNPDNEGQFFVWVEVQNNTVVSANWGTNEQVAVYLSIGDGTIGIIGTGRLTSGTTAPTTTTNRQMWYDTENHIINNYSGGSLIGNNYSFPFIIATSAGDNATINSIDKTFNGIGYIGSTWWLEKNYRGLISNGKNADLTYKNIEWNNDKLTMWTFDSSKNYSVAHMAYGDNIKRADYMLIDSNNWVFDELNNIYVYRGTPYPWIDLGTCTVTAGVISNFNPKQAVRLLDGSGDVSIDCNLLVNSGFIAIKAPTIDSNTLLDSTPSANDYYSSLSFKDKNNVSLAGINCYHSTANNNVIRMAVNSVINGEIKSAQIAVGVESKDGLANFSFPKCTTKATTASTANSNRVAVIVQNYVNGKSWYRVWSDGWIEQGGESASGSDITLPKAFSNTNYTVTGARIATGGYADTSVTIQRVSASKIKFHSPDGASRMWQACGY